MTTLKEAFEKGKVVPYSDILSKEISENSFAVALHAVLNNKADKIYNDPELFFNLTHMTNNLKAIFNDVLTRVSKGGARPLMVIDTTFGGGKTHTLVGIYHMFNNPEVVKNDQVIKDVLKEVCLKDIPNVSLVSIDCHNISSVKKEGKSRTIWGEIGKQLKQYKKVETFDKQLRRPDASTINDLLESSEKPVVIIIDELVNYLKDAKAERVGDQNLAQITVSFFHTITDVIVNSKKAMLIVTLPGTESAYKEESELLEEYKKMVKDLSSREASFTVPMGKSEINEIIRKRLFDKVDESYARSVAESIQKFYVQHSESFPDDVTKPVYYEKIVKSYPFHPLLIDILYERISTLSEFQQTRSVLRILSHILKNVYKNVDQLDCDSVITPGIVDFNNNAISQELTNKIAMGQFQSVIKTDIVNDDSEAKCQKIDSKKAYGPCTRIATSVYLYTLIGTQKEISKGCSQKELVLSTSVEGITYPKDVINDALTLENNLWYVYNKTGKWFFSVQVNINKVISDATAGISKMQYDSEIKNRLRKMLGNDYFDVHIWSHDVRSPHKPTLVVTNYNEIKGVETSAPSAVKEIIEKEGTSFRTKKNFMYVLVAREDRISKMIESAKRYLAIKDLKNSSKTRDDIKSSSSKIDELLKEGESNLNYSIELSYSLIYYPQRTDIKCITVLDGYEGAKNLPEKIYNALSEKAKKIVDKLAPIYIVDKIIGDKKEITSGEIWSMFIESPAHPLPKNKQVLFDSITDGVENKIFGLYTSGIGDLISITALNYETVVENFYYRRRPTMGPKEAHYLIPQKRAEDIETKLNTFSQQIKEKSKEKGYEPKSGEVTKAKTQTELDDVKKIGEYLDWNISKIKFSFKNVRVFPQLQSKISLLLLGISGAKYSLSLNSDVITLIIVETEVTDFNSLMDVLFRLSNMFVGGLDVSIKICGTDELKIDSDIAKIISGLSSLGEELETSVKMEK